MFFVGSDKILGMGEDILINPTSGKLNKEQVIEDILHFIKEQKDSKYTLSIGTDSHSQNSEGKKRIDFVTAVVIHRIGTGGKYYWKKISKEDIKTLRDKIYAETLMSLEFAQSFVPEVQNILNSNGTKYEVEIHVDVGNVGETREMIKEVVGMVVGSGYAVKTKPYSYGASSIADRHA